MQKKLETDFKTKDYSLPNGYNLYYHNEEKPHHIEPHSHAYFEFVFLLEGDISLQIDNTVYPAQQYDMFIIPPHSAHRSILMDQNCPYQRFVFWMSQDYYENLAKESKCYSYIVENAMSQHGLHYSLSKLNFNTLKSKMIRILEELRLNRYGKDIQLELHVKDFYLTLNRMLYEELEPETTDQVLPLYANILSFIDEHLDEDLSLDRLANEFYVSKYYISHMFKENIGITVLQYITQKRLGLLKEALAHNSCITTIYKSYGFNNYSSFYRAFKKEFGLSPQEFQERFANTETPSEFHPKI